MKNRWLTPEWRKQFDLMVDEMMTLIMLDCVIDGPALYVKYPLVRVGIRRMMIFANKKIEERYNES